jgi:hypothetical protein
MQASDRDPPVHHRDFPRHRVRLLAPLVVVTPSPQEPFLFPFPDFAIWPRLTR